MPRKKNYRNWHNDSSAPEHILKLVNKALSVRKINLIAAMACRIVEHHYKAVSPIDVVQLLLQRANQEIDEERFQVAQEAFSQATQHIMLRRNSERPNLPADYAAVLVVSLAMHSNRDTLKNLFDWVGSCLDDDPRKGPPRFNNQNRQRLRDVLREIVPAPDQEWNVLSPSHGGGLNQPDGRSVQLSDNAVSLAHTIDVKHAFGMMPILADALEESGITDPTMLQHCREEREHMPGCWVVDLVLGHQ